MATANLLQIAFDRLIPDLESARTACESLRRRMAAPPRAYHNESHIEAVLAQLFAWTDGTPSAPLVAAALYHDAVYDVARHDNELQSAVFCHDELLPLGIPVVEILIAANLILTTQHHQPRPQNRDEILLVDADLYILGSPPDGYTRYVGAIRTEYAHVSDADWRTGRRAVMERFLQRDRIYRGEWEGRGWREAQARENITAEIATLI